MSQFLLVVAVALTVGAIVFGITVLLSGDEPGLRPVEPDGRAVPLPADRPLSESDLAQVRFDTALRGYRMAQVDAALRRAGYDIGYKDELIRVLLAEVDALRQGRDAEAEALRESRLAALAAVADEAEHSPLAEAPALADKAEQPSRAEAATADAAEPPLVDAVVTDEVVAADEAVAAEAATAAEEAVAAKEATATKETTAAEVADGPGHR